MTLFTCNVMLWPHIKQSCSHALWSHGHKVILSLLHILLSCVHNIVSCSRPRDMFISPKCHQRGSVLSREGTLSYTKDSILHSSIQRKGSGQPKYKTVALLHFEMLTCVRCFWHICQRTWKEPWKENLKKQHVFSKRKSCIFQMTHRPHYKHFLFWKQFSVLYCELYSSKQSQKELQYLLWKWKGSTHGDDQLYRDLLWVSTHWFELFSYPAIFHFALFNCNMQLFSVKLCLTLTTFTSPNYKQTLLETIWPIV